MNNQIIICEDDLLLVKSLKTRLETNGYKVIKTLNFAEDLIYWVMNSEPSLILTDISLSGDLDGIEAIARVIEKKVVPYIFITGFPDYKTIIKSYNLKPNSIFIKPIELELVVNNVKEILPIV